jgi:hypothetical protein
MKRARSTIVSTVLRSAVAIGFILAAAPTAFRAQEHSAQEDQGTLQWRVREAKKLGKTSLELGLGEIEYGAAQSLDVALEDTSLVLAKVLTSEADRDDHDVFTWRKYRVLEKLSFQRGVYERPLPEDLPADMLPIGPDEFVMAEMGGTIVIDGVTVTMHAGGSHPRPDNLPHLMFVLLVTPGPLALPNYGPIGAFWVDDSDKIHAEVDSDLNKLGAELLERTGGDLSGVRTLCIRCK